MRVARIGLIALLTTLSLAATADDAKPATSTGLPAPDHPWRGPDYAGAAKAFASQEARLPRYSDPAGSALLTRMTSADNLAYEQDKHQPLEARLTDFAQILRASNTTGRLYASQASSDTDAHQEQASWAVFNIKAAAIGNQLADEMVQATPKDAHYNASLASVQKIRAAFIELFIRGEFSISEDRKNFAPADLSNIISAMSDALPRIKPALSPESQHQLAKKLKADSSYYSNAADAAQLKAMVEMLGG